MIVVWRLENEEFHLLAPITIHLVKGRDPECSNRVLWDFAKKQFIVSGDGTIYFLHGTVDTVKVSKIMMD